MSAYYNEIDPFAAAWLRNLISAGLIAPGEVDERSIEDVNPDDLRGFVQCHFFAGIGVWSYALRLAGWPDDRPVWTGSCPCQPFSAAGKRGGTADERHLWPAFHHLINAEHPAIVFGEQVASKDGLAWLDTVHADMEAAGYAIGATDLCAASVGAPHIRQRLWFVGVADTPARGRSGASGGCGAQEQRASELRGAGGLADDQGVGSGAGLRDSEPAGGGFSKHSNGSAVRGLADSDGGNARAEGLQRGGEYGQQPQDGGAVRVADSAADGRREERANPRGLAFGDSAEGLTAGPGGGGDMRPGPTNGLWRDADWLLCRDERWRPVRPGTFPLAHGAPSRVGRLRAYGNAIVAEAAREFIEAVDHALAWRELMAA